MSPDAAGPALSLAFAPDVERLAVAQADGSVRVWEVGSGEEIARFRAPGFDPSSWVAFGPEGNRLLAWTAERRLVAWDVRSGEPMPALPELPEPLQAAAISPGGSLVAVVEADRSLSVWDLGGQRLLTRHDLPAGEFTQLAVSEPAASVAFALADGTIRLHNWDLGEEAELRMPERVGVRRLLFAHRGPGLTVLGDDDRVWLFRVPEPEPLEMPDEIRASGTAVAICPDAPVIAVGTPEGTVEIHLVESAPWAAEMAVAAARDDGGREEPAEVTVYYATSRELKARMRPAELMWQYAWGFFATGQGLLVTIAVGIVTVIVLITLGVIGRLRLRWLAASCLTAAALLAGIALLFAWAHTHRDMTAPGEIYGTARGGLYYGTCLVNIPPNHVRGRLETPYSVFSIDIIPDREKHVLLLDVEPIDEPNVFFEDLRARIAESEGREAVLFIHGYNVSFEDAARRTAQLGVDLGIDRAPLAPIMYSWPSQADFLWYSIDSNNTEFAAGKLEEFLRGIAARADARKVHLVAHSMGNRVLTKALMRMNDPITRSDDTIFREVVLTAPDVDTQDFEDRIADEILNGFQRFTLYASSNDNVLLLSKGYNGNPRLGDSGDGIFVHDLIDTIDVSNLDTGLDGHTYYGDNESVVSDLYLLLRDGEAPEDRPRLQRRPKDDLFYWVFQRP